jgi:hypothetical protein
MSGGGGGAPQTQKVESTTTNLPKYLEPYVTDIASRAQAESNREYTPYEGQRIAGFTPEQQQVQQHQPCCLGAPSAPSLCHSSLIIACENLPAPPWSGRGGGAAGRRGAGIAAKILLW